MDTGIMAIQPSVSHPLTRRMKTASPCTAAHSPFNTTQAYLLILRSTSADVWVPALENAAPRSRVAPMSRPREHTPRRSERGAVHLRPAPPCLGIPTIGGECFGA